MEKIPTAEEYIWKYDVIDNLLISKNPEKDLENLLIEFAKMHVETALYIASEMADLTDNGRFPYVDKTSILNSYSLDNIK